MATSNRPVARRNFNMWKTAYHNHRTNRVSTHWVQQLQALPAWRHYFSAHPLLALSFWWLSTERNSSQRRVFSASVGLSLSKESTNKLKPSVNGNGLTIHHVWTPGKVKYHAIASAQRDQISSSIESFLAAWNINSNAPKASYIVQLNRNFSWGGSLATSASPREKIDEISLSVLSIDWKAANRSRAQA